MGVFMKNKIINQLMLRRFLCLMLSTTLLGSSLYGCGNTQSDTAASVQTEASQDNNSSEIQSEALSELTTESNTESATNTTTDTDTSDWSSANAKYPLPTSAEDASIYIEPIPEITDDFIRGMDVSSILAQENSGVIYYNASGEEQDVFTTFAESGVNYARIRVWNDPYDENGNGYGGGNCDLETAIELGKRATENGMKVCIDFHYSDFWADPKKQQAPKAWEAMNLEDTDGTGNSVGAEDLIPEYAATVQSQATALRDVCATAYAAGGLGVFYWEGAWISVNDSAADNSPIWEKYGSGWASSYAASYDPNDAGKYYGGSSWDNQALFDSKGMPLESINTYKWLKYGTNAPLAVDFVPVTNVASNVDSEITLPDTLDVIYNDRKQNSSAADAHTDNYSFHFWSESDMEFTIVQNFTDLEPGTYSLKAFFQGGDINSDATMELFATAGDEASKQSAPFSAQGYAVWQEPTIDEIEVTDGTLTIGVAIKCNAKSWGTIDDFTLNKIK